MPVRKTFPQNSDLIEEGEVNKYFTVAEDFVSYKTIEWIAGSYVVSGTGAVGTAASFSVSPYLPIIGGTKLKTIRPYIGSATLAFYDKDNRYISDAGTNADYVMDYTEIDIPEYAKFFRVSKSNAKAWKPAYVDLKNAFAIVNFMKDGFGGDYPIGSGTFSLVSGASKQTTIRLTAGRNYEITYSIPMSNVKLYTTTNQDLITLLATKTSEKYTPQYSGTIQLYTSAGSGDVTISVVEDRIPVSDMSKLSKPKTPSDLIMNVQPDGNTPKVAWSLNDKYKYPNGETWGMEYLAKWYQKLFDKNAVKIVTEGDSITLGDDGGYRQKTIQNIFDVGGYPSGLLTIINNGHGNRATNEWVGNGEQYVYAQDLIDAPNGWLDIGMANTPDLLICGHGVNDAVRPNTGTIEERVTRFEANYREALNRIRGNVAINGRPAYNRNAESLGIILCMPTHMHDDGDNHADERWHVYVRQILKRLAREFYCAFADFAMVTQDMNWSPNSIWGVSGSTIHPSPAFTLAYSSIIQPLVFPFGLWEPEKTHEKILLKSPNASVYEVTVGDDGTLATNIVV